MAHIYDFTVLDARSTKWVFVVKSRCWRGWFLIESLRGESISLPISASRGCLHALTHDNCLASAFLSPNVSLITSCWSDAKSGPILCDPIDCSSPGSSVHGISQARILEWVAISFSKGSSQCRDQPGSPALTEKFFTTEPPGKGFDLLPPSYKDPYRHTRFTSIVHDSLKILDLIKHPKFLLTCRVIITDSGN